MIKKYRKNPIVIEAIQLTKETMRECHQFIGNDCDFIANAQTFINIKTLEGMMQAIEGDFIIKGIKGEFYPCKPDVFEKTYIEIHPDLMSGTSTMEFENNRKYEVMYTQET